MLDFQSLSTLLQDHKYEFGWIAATSAILFVGCLLAVPWLVVRIPTNYFVGRRRPILPFADRHPVLRWSGLVVKNLIGGILILAGVAMLILPGQGILTIFVGVLLLNFPGKHRFEKAIIRFPPVLKSVNWLRHRSDVPSLRVDLPASDSDRSPSIPDQSSSDPNAE